eukprot:2157449-Pyramimonas_sp.AAC.1
MQVRRKTAGENAVDVGAFRSSVAGAEALRSSQGRNRKSPPRDCFADARKCCELKGSGSMGA